jgi:hypothetical protein
MKLLIQCGVERDRAFEKIGSRVVSHLSNSLTRVIAYKPKAEALKDFASWWKLDGEDRVQLDQTSWAGLKLDQKYLNFLRRHKLPIVIRLTYDSDTTRGTYFPGDDGIRSRHIEIKIKESEIEDHMSEWAVVDMVQQHYDTIIHELVHAYDDYASEGKFRENKRSGADRTQALIRGEGEHGKAYLRDPIEINARFSQVIVNLQKTFWRYKTFAEYLDDFKFGFNGWDVVPPREQRRLIKRLGADYTSKKKTEKKDKTENVKRLQKKLLGMGARFEIHFQPKANFIRISTMLENGRDQMEDVPQYLPLITKFADTHRLDISAHLGKIKTRAKGAVALQKKFKQFNFVPNSGRTKNYAISDTWWRPSKR